VSPAYGGGASAYAGVIRGFTFAYTGAIIEFAAGTAMAIGTGTEACVCIIVECGCMGAHV
jgi:hypothetical protein